MNFADVKEWRIFEGEVTKVVDSQNRIIWEKDITPDYTEPFYVENISNDIETLKIQSYSSSSPRVAIEYSTNKITWSSLGTTSTSGLTYSLNPGDKLYLRSNNKVWSNSTGNPNYILGVSRVGGNIMSLIYGSSFTGQETTFKDTTGLVFHSLFSGNTNLISARKLLLPATTLVESCYNSMFKNCSALTSAPTLDAISLTKRCYYHMFEGCSSLIIAPALPATTLANECYYSMFLRCTSLTHAPILPATTLAEQCYFNMFNDCESLVLPPALPATTLANRCYSGMFSNCFSLATAPALPATTLQTYCYSYMFQNCRSLTTAPNLPATVLVEYCYGNMFSGCTSLVNPPVISATTLDVNCCSSMFESCSSLVNGPELMAPRLVQYCYRNMFYNCTLLNYVKCLATSGINDDNPTYNWFYRVSSSGTFVKAAGVTWPTGISGIPEGWTVEEV